MLYVGTDDIHRRVDRRRRVVGDGDTAIGLCGRDVRQRSSRRRDRPDAVFVAADDHKSGGAGYLFESLDRSSRSSSDLPGSSSGRSSRITSTRNCCFSEPRTVSGAPSMKRRISIVSARRSMADGRVRRCRRSRCVTSRCRDATTTWSPGRSVEACSSSTTTPRFGGCARSRCRLRPRSFRCGRRGDRTPSAVPGRGAADVGVDGVACSQPRVRGGRDLSPGRRRPLECEGPPGAGGEDRWRRRVRRLRRAVGRTPGERSARA